MEWIYPFKRVLTLRILGLDAQNQLKLERWEKRGSRKYDRGRIRCVKEPFDGTGLMKDMLG